MKSENWNNMIKPVVVLVVICILSSAALAGANHITAPIIKAQQEAAAQQAYLAVLPDADKFEAVTGYHTSGVRACMKAVNGAGWAIEAAAKGFGGDVPVVVGFDNEGKIVNVKFLENGESAGYGSRLADGSEDSVTFSAQFKGKSGEQKLHDTVDGLTGATVSSKAAIAAVNNAVNCFNEMALGHDAVVEEPELTLPQAIEKLAGGPAEAIETPEGLDAAYQNGETTVLVASAVGYTNGGYEDTYLTAAVGFDAAGTITGVWVDVSTQTTGVGDVANSEEFTGQFIGVNGEEGLDGVDTIAGATESTVGTKKAVRKCVKAFAAMNGAAE